MIRYIMNILDPAVHVTRTGTWKAKVPLWKRLLGVGR